MAFRWKILKRCAAWSLCTPIISIPMIYAWRAVRSEFLKVNVDTLERHSVRSESVWWNLQLSQLIQVLLLLLLQMSEKMSFGRVISFSKLLNCGRLRQIRGILESLTYSEALQADFLAWTRSAFSAFELFAQADRCWGTREHHSCHSFLGLHTHGFALHILKREVPNKVWQFLQTWKVFAKYNF